MTRELRGWPRALRDYADASGSRSGASGRRCARCDARLRRGNTDYAGLCAPCSATLATPQPRPASPRVCPDCGMSKHFTAARCRSCHVAYYRELHWHPKEEA